MELFGLPDWLVLVVTTGILLYVYAARNKNYWKKQNVAHEAFSLVFGPAMRRLTKPLHLNDQESYKKFGRLFGIYEGGRPTLMVAEPDLVKDVLVKDFSALPNRRPLKFFDPMLDNMMGTATVEPWRKIRTSVSPAFTAGKLRKMTGMILECVRTTCEHLKLAADDKSDVDVKQFFGDYGLDVIARCAFGTKLDSHTDSSNEFVTKANRAFSGNLTLPLVLTTLLPGVARALKIRPLNTEFFQYFKKLSLGVIKNRKERNHRHEDFLQLMMDAHEGNLTTENSETSRGKEAMMFDLDDSQMKNVRTRASKALTEDEALAQCVLFFLAGYDTISTVMACAAYELALNPDVQDKLRKEVDECFDIHGENISLDVISKLPYLHCIVSEVIRLYPPAVRIERSAIADYQLGEKVKVPKGSVIVIPIYSMHRDADFFPNPDTFDPERFSDEKITLIPPYSYLPFGAGPRNCVGMRFGMQVVKMGLIHSVRSVQFVRTDKTKVPLEFDKASVPVLKFKDVTVGVRRRQLL